MASAAAWGEVGRREAERPQGVGGRLHGGVVGVAAREWGARRMVRALK
uniref:Uncharacterized protein n=1 Tax=Arundo donax TaxID=35708 RepID=A0A0A9BK03_ARUDO